MADECAEDYPDRIAELFVNKTILLTGATGFVGKVFTEKLLRTCPNIEKMYVLVRSKKGKHPNDRMKEIFKGPLFDLLKKQKGEDVLMKVEAISANIEAPDLGLSPEDRTRITQEVHFIYHSAATIKFDERLRKAVFMNARGTKLMLKLAKECKKLVMFAHLSTSYCHLHERILFEKTYSPPTDPYNVIRACEWMDEKVLDLMTKQILGDIPNTYAFTKALAEAFVNEEMDNLPVVILRPSVIIPIWKDPIRGWTDNINGPMGLLIAAGKGVLRTMYCKGDSYSDYIPVDIVANCLVCCAFFYLQTNKRVFNVTTSSQIKVSFEDVINIGKKVVSEELPFNGVVWYPGGSMKKWRFHHNIEFFLLQYIPAVVLDALLVVLGYKPVLVRIQERIVKGYDVLEYYANHQWDFNNDETLQLIETLNPKERATYKLDSKGLDYYAYFKDCIHAARLFILKEPDHTIPAAKRHMKVMWFVDRVCKLLICLGFLYLLYKYIVVPYLKL